MLLLLLRNSANRESSTKSFCIKRYCLLKKSLNCISTKLYFFLCNKGWHSEHNQKTNLEMLILHCRQNFFRHMCHPLLHKKKYNFVIMPASFSTVNSFWHKKTSCCIHYEHCFKVAYILITRFIEVESKAL